VRRVRRALRPAYVALATWSINFPQERHAALVADRAARQAPPQLVLVVGAGLGNTVVETLRELPGTEAVSFDLRRADGVDLVADAHAMPLADGSVDVVVAQAVLEHVMDPVRVVAEIERVLRPGGLVYSDTPFLQPYHADPTDWQRFTLPGHRLLFHGFEEIESGTTGGPFMAALWTFHEALRALLEPWPRLSAVTRLSFRLGFSWLKYLDAIAIRRHAGATAASGTYFFGARRAERLALRERFEPRRWARERRDV
jgi:SAM-dependent methyltransferase